MYKVSLQGPEYFSRMENVKILCVWRAKCIYIVLSRTWQCNFLKRSKSKIVFCNSVWEGYVIMSMRVCTRLYSSVSVRSCKGHYSIFIWCAVHLLYAGSYSNLNFLRRFYKSVLKWFPLMWWPWTISSGTKVINEYHIKRKTIFKCSIGICN